MDTRADAEIKAMELIGIGVLPLAMKAIIELNVLEILSKAGPDTQLTAAQIVTDIPTTNPNAGFQLDRILRLLASHSVLSSSITKSGERVYGLTPMCKYFLPDQDGVSLAPMVVTIHDKVLLQSWHYLKDSVLKQGSLPFTEAFGMSPFEYSVSDTRFNKVFNAGMFDHSTLCMRDVLQRYKGFQGLGELVDVGGGTGGSLKMILSQYPNLKGINFDLPHVVADAPSFPGVKHIGGDMFESVPSGDAIFMKWILHDWDDGRCLTLLKNCWNALPEHGKVIIVEWILPSDAATDPTSRRVFTADLMMLAFSEGGKERTLGDYGALAKEAGFTTVKDFPCANGISVIEFHKK